MDGMSTIELTNEFMYGIFALLFIIFLAIKGFGFLLNRKDNGQTD